MPRRPTPGDLRAAETATWGPRPTTATAVKIRRWQPYRNPAGTVLGFLSIELGSGLVINDLKLMTGPKGGHWLAMPSIKAVDRDGQPIVNAKGKPV
jgi:DNA-binding cell septation regulator SpoVG